MRPVPRLWAAATLALAAAGPLPTVAASSHGEAPFVARNPKVDGTDLYLFRSYEPGRSGYVTLIANYQPYQDAFGGPEFFPLDGGALYEIHVDNNGDAREDLTFRFRFTNALPGGTGLTLDVSGRTVAVPVLNIGPVSLGDDSGLNRIESYSVELIRGDRTNPAAGNLTNVNGGASEFRKPTDNVGDKTFGASAYEPYARAHVYDVDVPGCMPGRVFVGQRREPFAINAGGLFDLVNLPVGVLIGPADQGRDALAFKNVTTLALELPIPCVAGTGPVIGAWSTSHVPNVRPRRPRAGFPPRNGWIQVSRMGGPLVNTLLIGLKDKDRFNESRPADDAQFFDYVTHPTWPEILELQFGSLGLSAPNFFPRVDLIGVFLAGLAGVNQAGVPAEMLRLNTTVAPTPRASQNYVGLLACYDPGGVFDLSNPGCDAAGYPNGRRPGDDVVDIFLRLSMGYLLPPALAPTGNLPLVDGAFKNPANFDEVFPYLLTPVPGAQ